MSDVSQEARFYEPPEDRAGTVFDPCDETFGPIIAALQSGDFERAAELVAELPTSREARWWILDAANGSNRITEVTRAARLSMVALVDEARGGVVGYLAHDHADAICEALNRAFDMAAES